MNPKASPEDFLGAGWFQKDFVVESLQQESFLQGISTVNFEKFTVKSLLHNCGKFSAGNIWNPLKKVYCRKFPAGNFEKFAA